MQTIVSIPGIHCDACARLIKDVSGEFPAIHNVDVHIETKTVTIDHDEDFTLAEWIAEIESLDEKYHVQPIS